VPHVAHIVLFSNVIIISKQKVIIFILRLFSQL